MCCAGFVTGSGHDVSVADDVESVKLNTVFQTDCFGSYTLGSRTVGSVGPVADQVRVAAECWSGLISPFRCRMVHIDEVLHFLDDGAISVSILHPIVHMLGSFDK